MEKTDNRVLEFFQNPSNFRICYVITMLFGMVTFLDYISYIGIVLLFVWGVYLLIRNAVIKKQYSKIHANRPLLLFLALGLLTAVVQITSGALPTFINFATIIITAFYMLLFFGMQTEDEGAVKRELVLLSKWLLRIITACNVIGIILLAVFHKAIWLFDRCLIVYENRFEGIFINPNPQGFASFCGLLFCMILSHRDFMGKAGFEPLPRGKSIPIAVLLSICLFLSASNGAVMIVCCFIIVLCFYYLFCGRGVFKPKQLIKRIVAFVLCIVAGVSGVMAARSVCEGAVTAVLDATPYVELDCLKPTRKQLASQKRKKGKLTFKHLNTNIDSGRFDLFDKAIDTFESSPVFGVGYGNAMQQGIAKRGNLRSIGLTFLRKFTDYHNAYLTLLASGGILGFAAFFWFGVKVFRKQFHAIRKSPRESENISPFLFAFLCAYCVYACVEPTMLYYPTFSVVIFWEILGVAFSTRNKEV